MRDIDPDFNFRHWLQNLVLRSFISFSLLLPYGLRVPFFGSLMRFVIAPITGYRRRSLDNLAMIWPDLPLMRRQEIAAHVSDNVGRTVIENYSSKDFMSRMAKIIPVGPGMAALRDATARGQAAILVTGHFGNYEAARASLVSQGFAVGGLYRAARNSYFNEHYVRTMEAFGGPVFAQGRRGTAGFVRHLRGGGQLVLLFDQDVQSASAIDFLGRPARTATSAADLALRYNALLIPFYATRQADGLTFVIELEDPIPASDAKAMTEALSTSLEARIRANPDQWFWIHRRWKNNITRSRRPQQ